MPGTLLYAPGMCLSGIIIRSQAATVNRTLSRVGSRGFFSLPLMGTGRQRILQPSQLSAPSSEVLLE